MILILLKCLFPCCFEDTYEPIKFNNNQKYYAEGNRFIENSEL